MLEELIDTYKNFCRSLVYLCHQKNENVIDEIDNRFSELFDCFKSVNFRNFTKDQLIELGFSSWDGDLLLAPTWVIDIAKEDTLFTTINGDIKIKGIDDFDMDTRYGSTAYGILISELRGQKITNILETDY